ncbi:MAG: cytochrome c biogenesis protein ResB, partial [Akkermansia sp.]|nr:cytochrome c biogenesis protein ResB [Akkermansia sp.]
MQSALFLDYGRLTLMDRERTDAVWKKYGRSLWNFAGSYGLGIALMLILLVLTFAGTLHQVRLSSAMGSEAAIESFFGAAYVLIPLGGENSLISLPLPGMGITCVLLFANLLIGGVFRIRWTWRHAGVLVAHGGILLLLAGIMLGNKMTVAVEQVELPQGDRVHEYSLPFDLRLNRFVPEFYPGTSKPKSYESQITVFPESGGQYDAVIRMNEPLRLSGWTLYQMSWGQDSLHPGRLISILRASHNPLEQMPKWSSYIIAIGLLWHFACVFGRYLRRKPGLASAGTAATAEPQAASAPGGKKHLRLAGICLLVAAIFGVGMLAARPAAHPVLVKNYVPWSPALVERAGAMAVQDGGRLKPVSTYAGFHLLRTLGKRSFVVDTPEGKRKLSPVEWMLDCMFRPELAEQYPVFLVNREEVVRRLHLPDQKDKRKKYSYAQLAERWEEMTRAVREIRLLGETNLTEAQKEI